VFHKARTVPASVLVGIHNRRRGKWYARLTPIVASKRPSVTIGPFRRLRVVYDEYPSQFWMLLFGLFIDRLGGALVWPFLTLYITDRFGVGMTQLGLLITLFSLMDLVGSTLGGALADRVGRRSTLILGLVASALTSLLLGWANSVHMLAGSLAVVGSLASIGHPAAQAMVADLLPLAAWRASAILRRRPWSPTCSPRRNTRRDTA
jgi:predicted MFS family arabinose efflux permease